MKSNTRCRIIFISRCIFRIRAMTPALLNYSNFTVNTLPWVCLLRAIFSEVLFRIFLKRLFCAFSFSGGHFGFGVWVKCNMVV